MQTVDREGVFFSFKELQPLFKVAKVFLKLAEKSYIAVIISNTGSAAGNITS